MRQLDLFGPKEDHKPVEKKPGGEVLASLVPGNEAAAAIPQKKEIPAVEDISAPLKVLNESKSPAKKVITAAMLTKRGRKSFKDIDAETDLVEIPEDAILFSKRYYSISEVAEWFKVNTSLLRFWENEFDVLKPRKNRKGDRLFRPEDVKTLEIIYYLLRQRKFSVEGAKQYLKDNEKKAGAQMQLIQSLKKFKSFLQELKTNLAT